MGVRLLKIAAVYFAIASIIGLYAFFFPADLGSLVASLNAGWASLALAGIIYHVFPKAAQTGLAQTYFWLYNIGLPVGIIGGLLSLGWLSGVATIAMLVGLLIFAITVYKDLT